MIHPTKLYGPAGTSLIEVDALVAVCDGEDCSEIVPLASLTDEHPREEYETLVSAARDEGWSFGPLPGETFCRSCTAKGR